MPQQAQTTRDESMSWEWMGRGAGEVRDIRCVVFAILGSGGVDTNNLERVGQVDIVDKHGKAIADGVHKCASASVSD